MQMLLLIYHICAKSSKVGIAGFGESTRERVLVVIWIGVPDFEARAWEIAKDTGVSWLANEA